MIAARYALAALAVLLLTTAAYADAPPYGEELLDRMVGEWLMTGVIAGGGVHHDLSIGWVLDGRYLRITEVAREKDEDGKPAYEAIIFIGWDPPTEQFTCLWLDVTGSNGLNGEIGYCQREGDTLPWVFGDPAEGAITNTFAYDRAADTWSWVIDNVKGDARRNFARVTLERK